MAVGGEEPRNIAEGIDPRVRFVSWAWSPSGRRVYATLLDRWLGVPNRQVLGAAFEPVPVLPA